jgi:hypothetical protein
MRVEPQLGGGAPRALRKEAEELDVYERASAHAAMIADVNAAHLEKILLKTYERAPEARGERRAKNDTTPDD